MIFEPETCLYVSSIPKPQIHEKKFLNFSKWRIFSNTLLFSGKTAFLKISADFVTGFQKSFFHLKALQTRMQIDGNIFFQLKWFRRYPQKHKFQNQLDVYFCYSLYLILAFCQGHILVLIASKRSACQDLDHMYTKHLTNQ